VLSLAWHQGSELELDPWVWAEGSGGNEEDGHTLNKYIQDTLGIIVD